MKNSNKYTGKKLRRPEIDKSFVKITSKLITCADLTDSEYRLICLLFSYSNGTTITVKNIAEKLHKSDRTILDILSSLVKKGVLNFTETHLELFNFSKTLDCEIPQCKNPQSIDCDISHPVSQISSLQAAENFGTKCEKPQSNPVGITDNQSVTDTYKIIDNKMSIDKTISYNTSISSGDNSSFSIIKNDDLNDITPSIDNSEKTLPIEDIDFKPREELEKITSKEGKTHWKLKNRVSSNFLSGNITPKFVEIYNQWINLDITINSKYSFAVFEIVAVYMIVTCNPMLVRYENNEELDKYVRIYSLNYIPTNLSDFMEEFIEDSKKIIKKVQPFRLPDNLKLIPK